MHRIEDDGRGGIESREERCGSNERVSPRDQDEVVRVARGAVRRGVCHAGQNAHSEKLQQTGVARVAS